MKDFGCFLIVANLNLLWLSSVKKLNGVRTKIAFRRPSMLISCIVPSFYVDALLSTLLSYVLASRLIVERTNGLKSFEFIQHSLHNRCR